MWEYVQYFVWHGGFWRCIYFVLFANELDRKQLFEYFFFEISLQRDAIDTYSDRKSTVAWNSLDLIWSEVVHKVRPISDNFGRGLGVSLWKWCGFKEVQKS